MAADRIAIPCIVSGGQTGVDRGALDAALAEGVACGGWCPEGRHAEDGPISPLYPLTELAGAGYAERTLRNVQDTDATLILYYGLPEGGTALTLELCHREGKPCLALDARVHGTADAVDAVCRFVIEQRCARLNVAGPRASKQPGARDYAYTVVRNAIRRLKK